MRILIECGLIGAAGFCGAATRYLITLFFTHKFGVGFPVGTMVINITGSMFLGFLFAFAARRVNISPAIFLAISSGFLGAYTTFSTLMFDSSRMLSHGEVGKAMFNLLGSFLLGMFAVSAGLWLGER